MNSTPIIDMFSGTARIRLAGNAVVGLQRGLTAINDTRGTL